MRGGARFSTGTRVTVTFNEGQSIFNGTHQGVFTVAGNDESGETTWGQIKFDDSSSYPGLYFNYNVAHNWYTVTPTRAQTRESSARQVGRTRQTHSRAEEVESEEAIENDI